MTQNSSPIHWQPFNGEGRQIAENKLNLPEPPPWRAFNATIPDEEDSWNKLLQLAEERDLERGKKFRLPDVSVPSADSVKDPAETDEQQKNKDVSKLARQVISGVNASICLRRPLLITGRPGSGKTSLAYALAYQLKLGPVLKWPITARTTLQDGLYRYDAIARLQDSQREG
ncbi:MAG: ATPase, partial [Cyanobacteria bacterium P01_H01_bin.15]